jgi:hypothetical protein
MALDKEEKPSDLVPEDLRGNLEFRYELLRWSHREKERQQIIANACVRDLKFFCNALVWAFDVKRYPDAPDRPFIVWPFQEEVLEDIDKAIGRRSVGICKSRDLGGSTMPLVVFDRRLLFFKSQTLMVMSRTEKFVDDPRNPDSLFYKLDYMHRWMPSWVTAPLNRIQMTYENTRTASNIIGSSTTGDAGRGGRKQAVLIDEYAAFDRKESFDILASLQHNTKCRIFNSTPKGVGNGFHQVITAGNILVHKLHWSRHPVHGLGLYKTEAGRVKILDQKFWEVATCNDILEMYPELEKKLPKGDMLAKPHYPFITDGKMRSPYYDYECLLCPIVKLIAQELDMDFIGSGSPFFDLDELKEYIALFAKRPFLTGEITTDEDYDNPTFAKSSEGLLELWFYPDRHGKPPADRRYVLGCDISAGTKASNSTISVGDCRIRSKVAAVATPDMNPHKFAEYAIKIAKWFNTARIIFEGAGVGSDFGLRLKELGYPSIYYQTKKGGEKVHKPGWFPDGDMKRNVLAEYGRALQMREFTNPDRVALQECEMYEYTETGKIAHIGSVTAADPSGAKQNHGDRVIADALCWNEVRKTQRADAVAVASQSTTAYLQRERELAESQRDGWSPRDKPRPWSLVRR